MEVARRWEKDGAEIIHMIDLDSALGTGNNELLIEMVVTASAIPVQVGGGIKSEAQVQRLFDIGCERVIVGTRAIQDRPFIEKLAGEYPESVVVAIDSASNEVLIKGWQESSGRELLSVAAEMDDLPIYGFLYTNVEVEGRLQGIDPAPIKALMNVVTKSVIVSGGITTMGDLDQLQRMGAHSAIVGMAIYTGRIDFKKAVREFR